MKLGRLSTNFFFQSIYQLLTIILPFVTVPYVARVLGPEGNGIFSYTFAIANYFVVFAMLGIENYGSREIARQRNFGHKFISKTFTEIFLAHTIISVLSLSLYIYFILFIFQSYKENAFWQIFFVISAIFDVNWLFIGLEKIKFIAIRNFLIKIITTILIFTLVKKQDDLWIYTFIMSGSIFISQLIVFPSACHYFSKSGFSLQFLLHFKPLCLISVAVIASYIYRLFGKVIIGYADKIIDLACFEYADKIIRLPLGIITALGLVLLPRISKLSKVKGNKKEIFKLLTWSNFFSAFLVYAFAFGLAAIADDFSMLFLGPEYFITGTMVKIFALSLPFIAWNNFVRMTMLIPQGKDSDYMKSVVWGAVINVLLSILVVSKFGGIGVAWVSVASYFAVSVLQTTAIKNKQIAFLLKKHIPYCIIGLTMYVCISLFNSIIPQAPSIRLPINIILGMALYSGLFFIYIFCTKERIALTALKKIFHRE